VRSLQAVHRYPPAAWISAGHAVQIEILTNRAALSGHLQALAWESGGFGLGHFGAGPEVQPD